MSIAPILISMIALNVVSGAYVAFSWLRFRRFRRRSETASDFRPPVTVLKPVCGLETGLYENLRSFCDQDYPAYQVVFGLRSADDAAVAVVRRLIEEFPDRAISLVIDERIFGLNPKASNLCNMMGAVAHDLLVVADSDMRVGHDYLATIVAPFRDADVGAVTCLYRGTPDRGLASMLGAMFINEWFLPSVLVAGCFEKLRYCFGATMAVRRTILEKIGGFQALAGYLADDHMLGHLVAEQGYKVCLSSYVVENIVSETDLKSLFSHELRWARTVRTVRPMGYAFSFVMYAVPLALLAAIVNEGTIAVHWLALASLAIGVLPRLGLHRDVCTTFRQGCRPHRAWLVLVRDMMCFLVWGASFFGRRVQWRRQLLQVESNGNLSPTKVPERDANAAA